MSSQTASDVPFLVLQDYSYDLQSDGSHDEDEWGAPFISLTSEGRVVTPQEVLQGFSAVSWCLKSCVLSSHGPDCRLVVNPFRLNEPVWPRLDATRAMSTATAFASLSFRNQCCALDK